MKEQITVLLEKRKNLVKEEQATILAFQEWVKDKSIPLEDRWNLFIDSGLGREMPWIEHFKSLSDDAVGPDADYSVDRYEIVNIYSLVGTIEEAKEELEEEPDTEYERPLLASTDLIAFKEEVLAKFIKSYKFSW